jgi:hypothetical protein
MNAQEIIDALAVCANLEEISCDGCYLQTPGAAGGCTVRLMADARQALITLRDYVAELEAMIGPASAAAAAAPTCQGAEKGRGCGAAGETGPDRPLALEEVKEITRGQAWHMRNGCLWLESRWGAFAPCFTDAAQNGEVRIWSIYLHPANIDSNVTWWKEKYYGSSWRLWGGRPADDKRASTPWKEDD